MRNAGDKCGAYDEGHSFQPRYDMTVNENGEILTKTYLYEICVACGKIVRRSAKEPR